MISLKSLSLFLALLFLVKATVGQHSDMKERPNILLILADDMGYSDISCFGGEIHTPNIDRLAEEGIRFTHMYTNAWCSPSRASLLTGLYPQQAGMGLLAEPRTGPEGPYEGYLNKNCVTLAEVFKAADYATSLSGKWHLGDSSIYWPVYRGFDHAFGLISGAANYFDLSKTKSRSVIRKMALNKDLYHPPKKGFYMTDAITADALQVLDTYSDTLNSKPFFMYVAYTAPHWPLQALEKDIKKYKGKFHQGWDKLREQRFNRQKRLGIIDKTDRLANRDIDVKPWKTLSVKQKMAMEQKMEVYAAQIDRMDQGIGQILDKLNSMHQKKNTIIIFLSDNGGCAEGSLWGFDKRKNGLKPGGVDSYMSYGQSWANLSNTPFQYYKRSLFEGGISTPMIIRWPKGINKKREGTILKQVAHLTDIMPTLCALTGAQYPDTFRNRRIQPMEGQSLARQIKGAPIQPHKPIYWSLEERKAVILGNYKLETPLNGAAWQLYNLATDRIESENLSDKEPERVRRMKALWNAWASKVHVFDGQHKNHME